MRTIGRIMLVLIILALALPLTGCGARFKLSVMELSKDVCLVDEEITVTVDLANTGGEAGEYFTELMVDGVIEQTYVAALAPDEEQTVSFTLARSEPGQYAITIDRLTATLTVLKASDLEISAARIETGESVTVSATLENTTDAEVSYGCCLLCDGETIRTTDLTLAAGATGPVSFELSDMEPGTYQVGLSGLTDRLIVLRPAEFHVTGMEVSPNPGKVGGEVKVTATIQNQGEVSGTSSATLTVNGRIEETQDFSLGGGGTKKVTFTIVREANGNYEIDVNGEQAMLEVIVPNSLETGTFLAHDIRGGESQIKLINNYDCDIVITLSEAETPEVAGLAVYVQAGDTYTVKKIPDSVYVMAMASGDHWDEESQQFLIDPKYVRFFKEFDFSTRSYQYIIWTIYLGGDDDEDDDDIEPLIPLTIDDDDFPSF